MNPSESIYQQLNKLRSLTQIDIQSQWILTTQKSLNVPFSASNSNVSLSRQVGEDAIAPLNEKGYIVWEKGHQVQWLTQTITIPYHLKDYPLDGFILRLALTWWAEDAQIYVNNQLVQAGDLFDSTARVLLTSCAKPGEILKIVLRLVSPGHDIGGLMRSQLIYEREYPHLDPGFIADEIAVLAKYLETFESEKLDRLAQELTSLDWENANNRKQFDQALEHLRNNLKPLAQNLKEREFYIMGHAHLDMAWLWPLEETWDAGERTFNSVLNLQKEFADLTFGHTSPMLYEWIEKNRPKMFQKIQQAVKNQQWELLGGMWVEPDVNLISGESLVRQLLYGQCYFQSKFNQISKVAWLPDSFGFCSQLPQICTQGGIQYFVTGKLHWNDTTKFPYGIFQWRSPDTTQITTVISPPNVAGVMDTNPLTMTNYSVQWEQQTGLKDIFWIPGVGDHGGGPTRDMWQVKKRWQASEFFPKITSSTAFNYLEIIKNKFIEKPELTPVIEDDLYLEFHRGCYTTHADQKMANRRSEHDLFEAELWSSVANLTSNLPHPKEELETVWKKVLLNQFHDILPGTSIPDVFATANQDWQAVKLATQKIIDQALTAIAARISLDQKPHEQAKPIVIFNSLNWQRSEVVSLKLDSVDGQILNCEGRVIPTQLNSGNKLLFMAESIPSIGYQVYWLCPQIKERLPQITPTEPILENEFVRVKIDSQTGEIESYFDKIQQREILSCNGNQLQFFSDRGQYWDAWNIDPNYADYPLPSATLESIQILESGPIRWRVRVIKIFQSSQFIQDYLLDINSPILKIQNQVHWQENQVLVKVAFPLNLESEKITYEVPCAVVERLTHPKTEAEKAKWEVSALHWGDLSDETQNYGVSLLNDCKYGYDGKSHQLRLTLLRAPHWPDPNCDRGEHHFTYAIYPHTSNWQTGQTVRQGYQLNRPLRVHFANLTKGNLSPNHSFLNLASHNLCLMAFKPSEDEPNTWILRLYEYQGEKTSFSLENSLNLTPLTSVDLLEQEIKPLEVGPISIEAWQIVSFKLIPKI